MAESGKKLSPPEVVGRARRQIEDLSSRLSPPLHFRLVGPLPPYSFVRLAMPAVA